MGGNYNPKKHHRRSIRLKGYDYTRMGFYFITLCTRNRKHVFGEISGERMQINEFGQIVLEEWFKSSTIRKNIALGEFIVMPDHIHGIIEIEYTVENNNYIGEFKSPSQTIGTIIRGFKGVTTKRIKNSIREFNK